jgi:hypothetical protein
MAAAKELKVIAFRPESAVAFDRLEHRLRRVFGIP